MDPLVGIFDPDPGDTEMPEMLPPEVNKTNDMSTNKTADYDSHSKQSNNVQWNLEEEVFGLFYCM